MSAAQPCEAPATHPRILAIDPGPKESALLLYDPPTIRGVIAPNADILAELITTPMTTQLAIEMVASYGMPVGAEVFETVYWIGRFDQAHGGGAALITRKAICLHLCGSRKAGDPNIRRALLDRFGPKGTKKHPGPLYGIKKDLWSALAIAVTCADGQS